MSAAAEYNIDADEAATNSPSKRRAFGDCKDTVKYEEHQCEFVYNELVADGIELISVVQTPGQDGFLNHIRMDIRNNGELTQELHLLNIVTRCVGPDNENILHNTRPSSDGKRYPRQVIVRLVEISTPATRKTCCVRVATFLNGTVVPPPENNLNAYRIYARRLHAGLEKYVVPVDFDKTAIGNPRTMSSIVVPRYVITTILDCYERVTNRWAIENPALARKFFHFPYPPIAHLLVTLS